MNNNRFLLLDLRRSKPAFAEEEAFDLAQDLCAKKLIDDLLILSDSTVADVRYRIFGGDRREAEFCCNGVLYTLQLLSDEGGIGDVSLETAIGKCIGSINRRLCLRLGPVHKVRFPAKPWLNRYLDEVHVVILGMRRAGEPHVVVGAPSYLQGHRFDERTFEDICAYLCHGFDVEGGVNVTMTFNVTRRGEAVIRTYERGAQRMTGSCGSGSLAAASVIFARDRGPFTIRAPGGAHQVWRERDSQDAEIWWVSASAHQEAHLPLGLLLERLRAATDRFSKIAIQRSPQVDGIHDKTRQPAGTLLDSYWT